ncbi:YraN family protein [Frigidibacter oleivorans]|uniref:YraN family protein n=1 Tax=Frigidibacter oleivorans TaxID=2487129 RepID=UPI000F8E0C52|nr:YraN family protein [Frigidibacter oleivorans]
MPAAARRDTGRTAWLAGQAAEAQVERLYEDSGRPIAARRWRGPGGEIDLIARDGAALIFVEVKASRSHAAAAERLSRRQMDRICASAQAFVAAEPRGLDTEMRFDVALVDGAGRVEIVENAFGG